ncbi:MAG: hypothetical protein J6C54_02870 [Lachnospiraceae bacterium]|nr:hypothetical protein [Lachnospiraceae bacterium]
MLHRTSTKDKNVVFMNKLLDDNYATLLKLARLVLPEEDMKALDDIVLRTFNDAWENVDMLRTHHDPRVWLMLAARKRLKAYSREAQSKIELMPINSNEKLNF